LQTQGEISHRLQIRSHDLAQTFRRSERRRAAQKNYDHHHDGRDEVRWFIRRGSFVQSVEHGASKTAV